MEIAVLFIYRVVRHLLAVTRSMLHLTCRHARLWSWYVPELSNILPIMLSATVHPVTTLSKMVSNIYPTRCNVTQFIISGKLLYMFWVVPPPIIRSAYNCIYSIWYLSHRYCYMLVSWKSWNCSFSVFIFF